MKLRFETQESTLDIATGSHAESAFAQYSQKKDSVAIVASLNGMIDAEYYNFIKDALPLLLMRIGIIDKDEKSDENRIIERLTGCPACALNRSSLSDAISYLVQSFRYLGVGRAEFIDAFAEKIDLYYEDKDE